MPGLADVFLSEICYNDREQCYLAYLGDQPHKQGEGNKTMARTVSIGNQDFKDIRENNYFYIDKTDFIREWWENGDTVTLITRPRRFGKTLAMSMLNYFFSFRYAQSGDMFEGLSVWKEEKYRQLQGTYPVISLSFASIKSENFDSAYHRMIQELSDVFDQYSYLSDSDQLTDKDKAFLQKVDDDMDFDVAVKSLNRLSRFLYKHHRKKVIILLDEYDTPMQEAYINGYWDEMTGFIRSLFDAAFKTNQHLERAIMTGITRISKESIFSDINNLKAVTVISNKYETSFGFTEEEVFGALDEFGLQTEKPKIKEWYDGFRFGNCNSIYNPWSIINFLDEKRYVNYWANTSSNTLVSKLIREGSPAVKTVMEDLLQGKPFHTVVDEEIVFHQLDYDEYAIWSLLLASGYLKSMDGSYNDSGHYECLLALTNKEVEHTFENMFKNWFASVRTNYNGFMKALLSNNIRDMNRYINVITEGVISYLDTGGKPSLTAEPEKFYHGFILGLIVDMRDDYKIESNRESGFGRYDVIIEAKDRRHDSIILEFKVIDPERERDLHDAADDALKQIAEKKYAASLEASGVSPDRIRIYGFAFQGKKVLIKGGYLNEASMAP